MTLSFHLSVEFGMEYRESPSTKPIIDGCRVTNAAYLRSRPNSNGAVANAATYLSTNASLAGVPIRYRENRRPSALNAASVAVVTATG